MRPPKQYQLNPEQSELARSHLNYAKSYITKYRNRDTDMGDLHQEASVGLCDAANLFDPDRNILFVTFATPHLREKCDRFVRHYSHSQILSIDDDNECPVETHCRASSQDICCPEPQVVTISSLSQDDDDEENLTLEDLIPDPDFQEAQERLNYRLLAERLLSILPDRDRNMVRCAFSIERKSQIRMRIWERFDLNKSRFYDIVDRAILKMKKYAHDNNIESPFSEN